MTDYDAIRAAHPDLAISLYGYTPGGDVTLEVIDPEGFTAKWTGPTAAAVLAQAFPEADPLDAVETEVKVLLADDTTPAAPSIFD